MENLDCMEASALMVFWNANRRGPKANRIALFGRTGRGTVRALKDCANYASNKATAMQCRARGDIKTALMYESICDRIYQTLPDFARW